jgi:hypothetical protein
MVRKRGRKVEEQKVWSEKRVKRMLEVYSLEGFKKWLDNVTWIKSQDIYVALESGGVIPLREYLKQLEERAKQVSS